MVAPLTWTTYLDTIARLAVVASNNVDFVALAPQMVNYAELRICRDLDLLNSVATVGGFSLVSNTRTITLPPTTFITIQEVNVITPLGTSDPNAGNRHQLIPVSKEYINAVYDSAASAGIPRYFAMLSDITIAFGPWPDLNYALSIVGTTRPVSLSAANTTTFIATYLPDLFIMASMIWISGYQRNFGRQSDDPQMAMSYEAQYMTLLKSSMVEEARKKFQASAWTSMSPPVVASPGRSAQAG